MSKLSDALAAKDKATKGPLTLYIASYTGEEIHGILDSSGRLLLEFWNRKGYDNVSNAVCHAANPDALDWIAKALPFMKLDLERRRFADYDDGENRAYGDREIATLTALIAQAEGTES